METIRISRSALSRLIWDRILCSANSTNRELFFDTMQGLELNREKADNNTGSINDANAWCLYALTRYFKPRVVAEVGTFIGRSTITMDEAFQDIYRSDAVIHTCDATNDISLEQHSTCDIVQYPKTMSTEMFRVMVEKDVKPDLMFIDGRLVQEDIELIGKLIKPETVIAFDDFEGVEKGISNAFALSHLFHTGYTLVYPPDTALLRDHGIPDFSNLAMIVPYSALRFTNQ